MLSFKKSMINLAFLLLFAMSWLMSANHSQADKYGDDYPFYNPPLNGVDCQAQNNYTNFICNDDELMRMDAEMVAEYDRLMSNIDEIYQIELKDSQEEWLI